MFSKSKTIILVALEDELPKKYLPTWNIIYSGVGKVNAAYSLSKAIHEFEPSTVINFGTAGTLSSNLNGLHEVLSCGTGDSFVNTKPKLLTDLVDMEAYALAKVCKLSQIEFICYKYISDNADDDANNAWNENLTNGALAFSNLLS
jgi:adenosylhomocysteine nucleosidase